MTLEIASKYLSYDSENGLFLRLSTLEIAGGKDNLGYVKISIEGKGYYAHKLAWMFHYGEYPVGGVIDHINHDKADNRIDNLRLITQKENMKNRKKHKNNKSGCAGVDWINSSCSWRARIKVDYKTIHLGMFKRFSDAVDARKNAEVLYGFHKNHGE